MADEVQPTLFGDGPGLEDAALLAKAPAPGVERADLSRMYVGIRAVEGGSGRTAIAPRSCLPCGCTPPLKGWARRGSWRG